MNKIYLKPNSNCEKCGNPKVMYLCEDCASNGEEELCDQCGVICAIDENYHFNCNN